MRIKKVPVGKRLMDEVTRDGKGVGYLEQRADGSWWHSKYSNGPWKPGGMNRQDAAQMAAGTLEAEPTPVKRVGPSVYQTLDGEYEISPTEGEIIGENKDGSSKIGTRWDIARGGFAHPENDGYSSLLMARMQLAHLIRRDKQKQANQGKA